MRAIQDCSIPTIALIEGICVGGGMEIASCCDLRICGESSRFGVPIKRLGLTMAAKELDALLRITSYSIAMEILLEGKIMSAEEAYKKNLVNRVVKDLEVETEAYKSAELISEGAPKVARWHKQFAKEILKTGKVSDKLNNLGYKCYDTEDFKIGYKSFLAKLIRNLKINKMPGPIKGVKVLELAQIMAGPTCGLMLADLGAEVIKIEKIPGGMIPEDLYLLILMGVVCVYDDDRNKKGIAINLKEKDGINIFKSMVKKSDVVIENYRKGTMEKLGIGYDELKELILKIILCEISGYGRSGPYAQKGGFDLVAQGMSGLMSITGESKDKPPMKVGAPLTDITVVNFSSIN